MDSYFSLLNLEPKFALDAEQLQQAWRQASAQVHPDRFATASATEKRIAMQWASRINQAYQTLKKPVTRAAYLVELAGHAVEAESNTRMAPEFLMKQMQWRECLAEAHGQPEQMAQLKSEILAEQQTLEEHLRQLLDLQKDYVSASERIRELMFIVKILTEFTSYKP